VITLAERRGQRAGTLSGGEQQMLAIAHGLMSRPRMLLMDEPSTGLAPLLVRQVTQTILDLNAQGVPCSWSSKWRAWPSPLPIGRT
jgi:branched-chain amino acid transport system ATP-binding protein